MSAYILALLLVVVPPGRVPSRETEDAARERYASIAEDVASVTSDRRTGALLVAIAVHESGLRVDVDDGRTRGPAPWNALGLWQLCGGVSQGMSRREQAREALARAARSLNACAKNDERHRLAAYASGSCSRGLAESAAMIDTWRRIR